MFVGKIESSKMNLRQARRGGFSEANLAEMRSKISTNQSWLTWSCSSSSKL